MKRFSGVLLASGLLLAASTAAAQSTIRPGQTVRGVLSASDRLLEDDTFYDCFALEARPGEHLEITLRSTDFDAWLAVHEGRDCVGAIVQSDDDGAGRTDSLIRMTLGAGPYSIAANTVFERQIGDYVLSAARQVANEPAYLGRSSIETTGELAAGDRTEPDGSFFDCYTFDVQSGQTAGIAMVSEDVDAFLSLHAGDRCNSEIAVDDDGLGVGTDAFIEHHFDRGGRYSIRANSLDAGETGRYGLVLIIE